jgi:hypothetical protein
MSLGLGAVKPMSHKAISLLNDISNGIYDDIASIETTMNDSDEPHSYEDISCSCRSKICSGFSRVTSP